MTGPSIKHPRYSDVAAWVRYHQEILAKQKAAGASEGRPQFGRFTGLPKGLPTMNEFGVTDYLERLGVPYETHRRVSSIDPDWPGGVNAEYDIYVPTLGLAIEINPTWHKGGKSEIPRVAQLDTWKEQSAKRTGIELVALDPTERASTFAKAVNRALVPRLQEAGIPAPRWEEYPSNVEAKMLARERRRLAK
jgi:hypothetical protein